MRARYCSTICRDVTRFSFIAFCISGIVASMTLKGLRCTCAVLREQSDTKAQRRTPREIVRVSRIGLLSCLIRYSFGGAFNRRRVAKIKVADRRQVVMEFVDERNTGGNIQTHDVSVRNVVEMLDQRPQAVAMRR